MLISVKYKLENELVLIQLLKGYGLLSRDGRIHSCNPYVKIELQFNSSVTPPVNVTVEDCTCSSKNVASNEALSSVKRPPKFTRSISLLHSYEQFKRNQLGNTSTDHCNDIDNLDLSRTRPHLDSPHKDLPSPSNDLSFKHEVSTTAQSKVVWHTRNPEFNELFLFRVTKEKLTSAFLLVSVMDKEILSEDTCIGHTTVPLGTLSITGAHSIPPQWFTIKKVYNQKVITVLIFKNLYSVVKK